MRPRYFLLGIRRYGVPATGVFDRSTGNRLSLHYDRHAAEQIVEALNRAIEGAECEATNGHGQGHTTNSE